MNREGLEATFVAMYQAEGAALLRYLRAMTRNEGDAEELCAEAFRRAWQAWPRFREDGSGTRAWLVQIGRNLAVDRARRERILPRFRESAPILDAAEIAVEQMRVRAALRRVPAGDRDLLAMRAAGLAHAEIAAVQGRSEDAVKMAWHRALSRLRAAVEAES